MTLMVVLGLMLIIGIGLTLWWGPVPYLRWEPRGREALPGEGDSERDETDRDETDRDESGGRALSVGEAARRYLRGAIVAVVAGFWAGALVTGPAMRLVMRLLAATAGDRAQGRLSEAGEIVGNIDLDATLGLYVFGGLLPALLSGFLYLLIRRWLPAGWMGGVVFGLLHLILAATRIDPLRPENIDFSIVGPGWLAVLTFGLAAIFHGMAVAAIANRCSHAFPGNLARSKPKPARIATALALAPPLLFMIPAFFFLFLLVPGMVFALGLLRLRNAAGLARSPFVTRVGRIAAVLVAVAYLPWTVIDLASIITEPQLTYPLPAEPSG